MPMCYRFVGQDGSQPTLDAIDRELCERTGDAVSEKRFSPMFVILSQYIGLAAIFKADPITLEAIEQVITERELPEDMATLAREFLCGRYKLEMWYSR